MLLGECEEYYDNVFILERIDFQDDAVPSEDAQEAQEIHSLIVDSYEMLGYSPTHIPVKPVDERVDIIINNM
jgi:predicted ATPase